MKDNLFYLLREYCKNRSNCIGCPFGREEDDFRDFMCRTEYIDEWSDEEIEEYTKFLIGGKNDKGYL